MYFSTYLSIFLVFKNKNLFYREPQIYRILLNESRVKVLKNKLTEVQVKF